MTRHAWFARAFALVATVLAIHAPCSFAALKPANIFSNHMVLQQSLPVPVWGTADAGSKVTVNFQGQSVATITGEDGKWHVSLKPMKADATGKTLAVQSGDDRVQFNDVLVGEVWFAGGQSNMAYVAGQMAKRLPEGKALVDAADFKAIRLCKINERHAPSPRDDLGGRASWQVCSPQAAARHSAVAFVFARRLHEVLKVPVAVIDCSWGGTPIEPYIPATAFTGHPTLEKLAALAKAGDAEGIKAMRGGTFVRSDAWLAGTIYNGRIAPVAPYAIRGALWYQGESNSGRGEDPRDYAHKMRALIKGWRASWGRDALPVFFVQLPQWNSYAWTYLREEQRRALDVKHTGMAVTIDLDNANDIHPPNKIDVGERLARWPLAKLYAQDVACSGPTVKLVEFQGGKTIVTFDHVDDGLMVGHIAGIMKVEEAKQGQLNGFELVGDDGIWHAAAANIEGSSVVITSPNVKKPVGVRYACHPQTAKDQPWNLYNKAGLPASPFCSDWQHMDYDPARNPMPK